MPKRVDHDDRRREISDAVLAVIAGQGVNGATFRAVAEATNWSTGVLSHYFRNRDDMLLAALRRAGEQAATEQRAISDGPPGREAVRRILLDAVPLDSRRLALARIFVFYYAEAAADPLLQAEINGYLERWRRQTVHLIEAAQRAGEIDPALHPVPLAAELVAMADGLSIHASFQPALFGADEVDRILTGTIERLAPR